MQTNIVIHVPHSSTWTPEKHKGEFLENTLPREVLRMTDRYCDELFNCGDMVVFPISRLVCDVERFRDDEVEMMAGKGMGVIYTRDSEGNEFRKVSAVERSQILRGYYDRHHELLTLNVQRKLEELGSCLIVDGHSFSAVPLQYEDDQNEHRPDFCIGTDDFHTPDHLAHTAVAFLEKKGYTVAVNRPFSGTLVPEKYYRKDRRVQSVMIEVNRGLYMAENGGKNESFEKICQLLKELIDRLKGGI
ncbi:MAG: hypothetical protein E7430_01965 [Ruminococcaceae bacterium]|nr:hypothetical protein [Oscillospiraceae bacterium]